MKPTMGVNPNLPPPAHGWRYYGALGYHCEQVCAYGEWHVYSPERKLVARARTWRKAVDFALRYPRRDHNGA